MKTSPVPAPPSVTTVYDRRVDSRPLISFFVPVFNERPSLGPSLDRLAAVPLPKEIIIVDDGSTDGSRKWLSDNPREATVLLYHSANAGKGAALRTALAPARGAYGAVHDADLEYNPADYVGMLKYARQNNIKAVFGSRFLKENPSLYRRYRWGNQVLTAWINFIGAAHFTDAYTGMKLMTTSVWKDLQLESAGFEVEAEICAKIARRNIPFFEMPVDYAPRRLEEGKKIRWRDAWRGLRTARHYAYS